MNRPTSTLLLLSTAALGAATLVRAQNPFAFLPPAEGERRISNIRQITNGGENAEAYWSADGKSITFQSTRDGRTCHQQFVMRAAGSDLRRVSTGDGKTTCGLFLPGSKRVFFGSSRAHKQGWPTRPHPCAPTKVVRIPTPGMSPARQPLQLGLHRGPADRISCDRHCFAAHW